MLAIGLTIYGAIAVAYAAALIMSPRPRGRSEMLLDGYDRLLLGAVGALASAAWILLVPVYAAGWLGTDEARRARGRLERRLALVGSRVLKLAGARGAAH